jgi:NAD-dependent deacetylase
MKKIVVFTGAGISAESGVETFRSGDGALWEGHKVEDVATPEGWAKDRDFVNKFYNERRAQLLTVNPNEAHNLVAGLEEDFEVTVVTQNVDDLHERAGSTKVYHLHGDIKKVRSTGDPSEIYDWGYKELTDADRGVDSAILRPHIVWFGEYPFHVSESYSAIEKCDYLLIVGTSLQIGYTIQMLRAVNPKAIVMYIDPAPADYLSVGPKVGEELHMIKQPATTGVAESVSYIRALEEKLKISSE